MRYNNIVVISLIFLAASSFSCILHAQDVPDNIRTDKGSLRNCTDPALGVVFLCAKNWQIRSVNDALLAIISTVPDVTMIITKISSDVNLISQLNREKLKKIKQYPDGFVSEKITLGGRDILNVKSLSDKSSNKAILDYYIVHNDQLYGIFFSVEPKKEMKEYSKLFNDIVEDLSFLKK